MRVAWQIFEDARLPAHLVVAALPPEHPFGDGSRVRRRGDSLMRRVQNLLERLIRQQAPTGDYATAIVREAGYPEVYLAFEREDDARKLGCGLHAQPTDGAPGWITRWTVRLGDEALASLAAVALPARKGPPKDTATPTSSAVRNPPSRARNWRIE